MACRRCRSFIRSAGQRRAAAIGDYEIWPPRSTSPFQKKLKYGRHTVVITATSVFAIMETDPAEVKFMIKSAK